jgi:hypothetical protein
MAYSGWGQLASAILSLLGGAGGMASSLGGTVGEIGSTVASVAKPLSTVASAAGEIGNAVGSSSRPTAIGGQTGSPMVGNPNAKIGITADQARTGLASVKAQGQAAGLSGLSDDSYIQQLAIQLGVDPEQIKQMLSSGSGGQV